MTRVVADSEASLLTVARAAVGLLPITDVMRLLVTSTAPPASLGPTARELLSDTLARGTVLALASRGGWANVHGQRLWERYPPPRLAFTGTAVRLLQWILRTPLHDGTPGPLVLSAPLTLAESILATLLVEQLKGTGCEGAVLRQEPLRADPLVVLVHGPWLARVATLEEVPALDIPSLAVAVDGLYDVLVRSWLTAEQLKATVERPVVLASMGSAQGRILERFLAAVDLAGRRDLARFIIEVAARYLATPRTAVDLAGALISDAPLRDRSEARRAAGALFRSVARLREWDRQHRATRFIDDGYELAQRLVKDWERLGERGFEAAHQLVADLDALPT